MDFSKIGNSKLHMSNLMKPKASLEEEREENLNPDFVTPFESGVEDERYSGAKLQQVISTRRESSQRQLTGEKELGLSKSTPVMADENMNTNPVAKEMKRSKSSKSLHRKLQAASLLNTVERPPNRKQIDDLENYMIEQIRDVLREAEERVRPSTQQDIENLANRVAMKKASNDDIKYVLTRQSVFREFEWDESNIRENQKTWMERLITHECIHGIVEDVSYRFSDMLTVTSAQLGKLSRSLSRTERESCKQLRVSWNELYEDYMTMKNERDSARNTISELRLDLVNQEAKIREEMEDELTERKAEIDAHRHDSEGLLHETEKELEHTKQTLSTLNSIFKTMQTDSDITSAGDFRSRYEKALKDLSYLKKENMELDSTRKELEATKVSLEKLERTYNLQSAELETVRAQINKRDLTISALMERDALRAAEIEKLQKMATLLSEKAEEDKDINFEEPPTSILCVKCKKGLDDMTNIREAIIGPNGNPNVHVTCQTYRLLLPNIKGRRPDRNSEWLRLCMRSILIMKMREDVALVGFKGQCSKFPEFVYSWFEAGHGLETIDMHMLQQADEDRWGFYYGVKALQRDDPEAKIFFMLMDEVLGEDGCSFVGYCISVALSIGGETLWKQFTSAISRNASIHEIPKMGDASYVKTPPVIWMPVQTAVGAVRAIFTKAMEQQVHEALETIYALKEVPKFHFESHVVDDKKGGDEDIDIVAGNDPDDQASLKSGSVEESMNANSLAATHVNFFSWLRVMSQRYEMERNERKSAIRLMFETASIGALTPSIPNAPTVDSVNQHVAFPQFQSVLRTVIPNLDVTEIATAYVQCYQEGNKFVTADTFLAVAEKRQLFTRSMKLPSLPISEPPPSLPIELTPEAPDISSEDSQQQQPLQEDEENDEELMSLSSPYISEGKLVSKEAKLRVYLGSVIHRKLQAIMPEIKKLLQIIPEKWKSLLLEMIESVNVSLKDCWLRSRKKGAYDGLDKPRIGANIDGIQPFIHYQRLLAIALTVKSMSSSPILPGELFRNQRYDFKDTIENHTDVLRAIRLLSGMESSLLTGITHKENTCKYRRIDQATRNILATRLKKWYSDRCLHENITVPRQVRSLFRAGYLRGRDDLRRRRILEEPWWGQSEVASILSFKLQHDIVAMKTGNVPLTIAQAIAAHSISKWGSVDVSERHIHDFFKCAREYEGSVSRLRMFLGFMDGCLPTKVYDADAAWIMQSDKVISLYLDLLVCIRDEEIKELKEKGVEITPEQCTLFPSMEIRTIDKREYWYASKEVLIKATHRWFTLVKGMAIDSFLSFADILANQGTADLPNMIDVDDYMYLLINMWVKNANLLIKGIYERVTYVSRSSTNGCINSNIMSFQRLTEIIESVYSRKNKDIINPPNESGLLKPDIHQGSKLYISIVSKDKQGLHTAEDGSMGYHTQNIILKVLKEWILWDLTSSSLTSSTQPLLRFNPTSIPSFTGDIDPSMSVAKAFKGWNRYSTIIIANLEQHGAMETSDQDQNKRVQMMRRIRLRFDELLNEFDERSQSEGVSTGVAVMKFKSFSLEQSKEIWECIRMCFSMHGDLLLSLETPLSWPSEKELNGGTRLFLDKSKAYDLLNATFTAKRH